MHCCLSHSPKAVYPGLLVKSTGKFRLVLQLRKNGVDQVILAGMSANLCVEAHLRELLEQGFEVAVVKDATAAARIPEGDGYLAAIINFRYMANAVWSTDDAVKNLGA